MPGGTTPPKPKQISADTLSQPIPPPPFSLTGAGAAAISATNTKSSNVPETDSQGPCGLYPETVFPSLQSESSILSPKPGCDVVALIFVLLMLPQSLSCLVLTSYILSGSFKSLAGKFLARYLLKTSNGIGFNLEAYSQKRYSYYRSELLGEFLQLFSINSFILLVCHYSLPRAWFQYLIVLAKSIIASRLVGTYSTGSTTYVSVVSNNTNNAGCITTTTTTTTNNGQNGQLNATTKPESRYIPRSFANFITGFSFVVAANYIKERLAHMNTSVLWGDFFWLLSSYHNEIVDANPFDPLYRPSSFLSSADVFSSRKSTYHEDTKLFSPKATWVSKILFQILVKRFGLGEAAIQRLSFITREIFIIINFAYLVLCIHVISLTISPFLKRIFILKDYSKTLDHLSCLTPDVSHGGFKKGGLVSNLPRDSSSESVVVISMEQPRVQSTATADPFEIKVNTEMFDQSPVFPSQDSKTSITAENFKNFCMKVPTLKTAITSSKQVQNRTIVDRKRSNSTTTASTTIMDKYFTISAQPIWSWLAAIKVLIIKPMLFSGTYTKADMKAFDLPKSLGLVIASVEDSRIVFQLLDATRLESLKSSLSVLVNGITWMFVEFCVLGDNSNGTGEVYISVYGLSSSHKFRVEFLENGTLLEQHSVSTTSHGKSNGIQSQEFSAIRLLQASIRYTITSLCETKIAFKKSKKEESKRVTELKRQIDVLKSKIDKYGVSQSSESRIGGKLKGLQNSVVQLENDIKELERQIDELENNNSNFEQDYHNEEMKLKSEIAELESYLHEYEENTNMLRMTVKNVEGDKSIADAKLKKFESKIKFKKEEIVKLSGEIKSFKKVLASKIQKRQKKVHDRIESIIPKISGASRELSEELEGCSNGGYQPE